MNRITPHNRFIGQVENETGIPWETLHELYNPDNAEKSIDRERYELVVQLMRQVETGSSKATAMKQLLGVMRQDLPTPDEERMIGADRREELLNRADRAVRRNPVDKEIKR